MTDVRITQQVKRMLAAQVAVAKIDGLKSVARAAQRALKAARAGDTSQLDAKALTALRRAEACEIYYNVDLDDRADMASMAGSQLFADADSLDVSLDEPTTIEAAE